jgi:hypothetical protein
MYKFFSTTVFLCLTGSTLCLAEIPTPVAYYPMNDGADGTTVTGADDVIDDGSHPATDATVEGSGGTWFADATRGIVYKTVQGHRLNAGTQGINLTNGFTWSLWVNMDSAANADSGPDVIIGSRNGIWNKFQTTSMDRWASISGYNLNDDSWHHVVIVGTNAPEVRVYIDNVSVGFDTTPYNNDWTVDDKFEIGGSSAFSEDSAGLIDDVVVWNEALSISNIAALFSRSNVVTDVTAPTLAATTPKDDDNNAALTDIQAIFNEPIVVGSGNVTLYNDTDVTSTVIDITDGTQITFDGASFTISPTNVLIVGKSYHIEMDAGVVKNIGGLNYAGISDSTTWNFIIDNTPPTLDSIVDNVSGGPVYEDQAEITYALSFSEEINAATLTTADFDNAGTASITIDSVTQTSTSTFSVVVLPTSTGTLQLRIPSGSVVDDTSGNTLVVPLTDDDTITINAGSNPNSGTRYWDPTSTGITDGISAGGSGTWSTSDQVWDRGAGITNTIKWNNSSGDSAVFGGSVGTVELTELITLSNLTFNTSNGGYELRGAALNFLADGVIDQTYKNINHTIRCAISGSPAVRIINNSGASYNGLIFAPTNGTVTLGVVTLPYNDAVQSGDKGGLTLDGTTTGNSVGTISPEQSGDRYARVVMQGSGTWTLSDVTVGYLSINSGTLVINGSVTNTYQHLYHNGGKLTGDFTIFTNDRRENPTLSSGATIAPGNGVGTVSFTYGTSGGSPSVNSNDYSLVMKAGSIYEWDVGPSGSDTIHLTEGGLALADFILKIMDAGGEPRESDQLPVFTYDAGVVIDMDNFSNTAANFDTSDLTGWGTNNLSLVDNGIDTIYLTGLSGVPGGAIFMFK